MVVILSHAYIARWPKAALHRLVTWCRDTFHTKSHGTSVEQAHSMQACFSNDSTRCSWTRIRLKMSLASSVCSYLIGFSLDGLILLKSSLLGHARRRIRQISVSVQSHVPRGVLNTKTPVELSVARRLSLMRSCRLHSAE